MRFHDQLISAFLCLLTLLGWGASCLAEGYAIVDTGQASCYDNMRKITCPDAGKPFFGQDAQYQGRQPSYRDNGDGTITDRVTGLMWQKDPGPKKTYQEAVAGASRCRTGGYDDWRLPGIKELYSLILFSGEDVDPRSTANRDLQPFIDTDYFGFVYGDPAKGERIIDSQVATSTRYVSTTMRGNETMFGVNFADGRIKGYPIGRFGGPRGRTKGYYVFYVRGNTEYGKNLFRDNGDGTITDQATGLTWMQKDSGHLKAGPQRDGKMNWEQALRWVENVQYAGHSDWRLPNIKELQSIVDYSRSPDTTRSAAIDPLFSVTAIRDGLGKINYPYYWSGTTHKRLGRGEAAAYIAFGRSQGWMRSFRAKYDLLDVHGAGSQRSDPKAGDSSRFPRGRGPQGDVIHIYNMVRPVRGGDQGPPPGNQPDPPERNRQDRPRGLGSTAPGHPNIVLIMTDDQGWGDVGYNGHPKIKTPNLDAMAAAGIRFDRFYAGASVCSPTRVSCLTGRNNWRMNISGPMRADEGHLPQEEITIAEALKTKGYSTGHFGKWHVGGFDAETSGTHVMPPWQVGFDECFSTHNVIVTHDPYAKLGKGGIKACYWHNGRNIPLEEAQDDPALRGDDAAIVMNKAIEFIRKQVAAKKPFLALVWFHNVHTPLGKNPTLMKQYADCETQEQVYYSNITAVDTQVGALRAELRKLGAAENTMVSFTSDNGPNLKGKKNAKYAEAQGGKFNYTPLGSSGAFRGWKRDCYEGGLRMPGILEWPAKIKKSFVTDFPAVTSDYFPTALDAAGIPLPTDRQYDGISLLSMIEGRETQRKGAIGFHANGMEAWTETRYKIVRTIKAKKKPSNEWELYDLLADPFEENDLAAKHPEIVARMASDFAIWARSVVIDQRKVIEKYYQNRAKPAKVKQKVDK